MNQELIDSLIELRQRLIYIIIGILLTFLILFHFANDIYTIIAKPLLMFMPKDSKLVATDITSPFFIPLKLTFLCAFLLSLPHTIYHIWQYLAPAMFKHEKRLLAITIISILILFSCGIIFCYYLVLPTLFKFIITIKSTNIALMTDITKYNDFVLNLFFIFGICFQTPIAVCLLIYFGIVKYNTMKSLRAYVFVGCFIIAAILTPPDVISQTMLAIPLYLLYECGMICGFLIKRPIKPLQN